MTTMSQQEQDVFVSATSLRDALTEMGGAPACLDATDRAAAELQHHRDAARHRVHRLRQIDGLRRPCGSPKR